MVSGIILLRKKEEVLNRAFIYAQALSDVSGEFVPNFQKVHGRTFRTALLVKFTIFSILFYFYKYNAPHNLFGENLLVPDWKQQIVS